MKGEITMVDFNKTNATMLNEVTLNGQLTYKLTDDEVLKVKSILDAMVSNRNVSSPVSVSTPVSSVSDTTSNVSTEKPKYTATKDFTAKYEVKKQMPKDGKKELFCISRANGWTKAEKACMNDRIKKLDGIKTIEVEYTDKDGKARTFSAWGYDTKKKAEEMMATLDTVIKASELNARF